MKTKKFKPMLGTNEPFELEALKYPIIGTIKKDGVRGVIRNNQLRTRSYKSQELPLIANKQIQELTKPIQEAAYKHNMSIDIEIYIHGIPLNEIVMFTNTKDINTRDHHNKIRRKVSELTENFRFYTSIPKELEFYIFDSVIEGQEDTSYVSRIAQAWDILKGIPRVTFVDPIAVQSSEEADYYYQKSLKNGFEGLVLRSTYGPYKYGRATAREQYFLKLKPIEELIGTVTNINERMENLNESFMSSQGYSIKRNTINNKEGTGLAATATIIWEGEELKVSLKGTNEQRREIWVNRDSYIGKELKFKGMLYGAKRVPRHPVFIEFI